jgi:hypothetical protein
MKMSNNSDQVSINNTSSLVGNLLNKDLGGSFGFTKIGDVILIEQQNNGLTPNPQTNNILCMPTNSSFNIISFYSGTDNIGGSFTGTAANRFISSSGAVNFAGVSTTISPFGATVPGWGVSIAPANATLTTPGGVSITLNRTSSGNLSAFHIGILSNIV